MSIRNQINTMVQLAMVDNDFSDQEKEMIYMLGKANGIPIEEINDMVDNPEPITVQALSDDEKFEYLYHIVQLMKIDKEVYLSEIKFCEDMAVKLGFSSAVISKLSSNIYSDPAITANREALKKTVLRYRS